LSFPLTGFIHGFITATGSSSGFSEIKDRALIGFMQAIASLWSYGKPWGEDAETETFQFRVYILITFLVLIPIIYKMIKLLEKQFEKK